MSRFECSAGEHCRVSPALSSRTCVRLVYTLLLVLMCQFHCSLGGHYHDNTDAAKSTFNCSEEWCGETWKPNRILRYKYEVKDVLVQSEPRYTIIHDCSGGSSSSLDCKRIKVPLNDTTAPTRRRTFTRTLENVTQLDPLSLHIITTDNINKSTGAILNQTYPHNQDKIWQFFVPKGCRMVVYFTLFQVEISDQCQHDNFTVQYKKDQQDIHRYCNTLNKIEIRKRRVQLKFHSNDAIAGRGIKAHVCLTRDNKRTDNELPCNCGSSGNRRKRAPSTEPTESSGRSRSYRVIKNNKDDQTEKWLKTLEGKSRSELEYIMNNSEIDGYKYLAGLYIKSLENNKYS